MGCGAIVNRNIGVGCVVSVMSDFSPKITVGAMYVELIYGGVSDGHRRAVTSVSNSIAV